jgi:hypothetical protein
VVEAGGVLRSVVGNSVAKIISNTEVGQNLANRRSNVNTSVAAIHAWQGKEHCLRPPLIVQVVRNKAKE